MSTPSTLTERQEARNAGKLNKRKKPVGLRALIAHRTNTKRRREKAQMQLF